MAARPLIQGIAALTAVALGVVLIGEAQGTQRLPVGGPATPVLIVVIGWAFTAVGCYAWLKRPDNRTGALLVAFGVLVLLTGMFVSQAPLLYLLSRWTDSLAAVVFMHLLLAFPSGRLQSRAARAVVGASYAVWLVPTIVITFFDARLGDTGCDDCPRNLLLLDHHAGVAEAVRTFQQLAGLALVVAALVLVAARWRKATAFQRRGFAPLLLAGAVVLFFGALSTAVQDLHAGATAEKVAQLVFIASFLVLPAAFLTGLVRTRFFRSATVSRLLDRLRTARDPGGVRDSLALALGDPTLSVAYWLPEERAYVDPSGQPVTLPAEPERVTVLSHQGRRVGALLHDRSLAEDTRLMDEAGAATALALENGRLEVELRARLEALRVSRQRIVEAADAERRRLGRDLHDGAQQRLVSLMIELQLAEERWQRDPDAAREHVTQALDNARAAVDELRELAAGIHPAVLSQRGLDAAVESLAARAPVPVELDVELDERLPLAVETAAYFVVAESLTNVAKYAGATHARVAVRVEPGEAVIEVADDGAGGADPAAGSGLRGLADRVGALGGRLEVDSPRGGGTVVRARLPVAGGTAEVGQSPPAGVPR